MCSRVSSGSDSFYLYVEDGNGNVNYTTVSKSGTITIITIIKMVYLFYQRNRQTVVSMVRIGKR